MRSRRNENYRKVLDVLNNNNNEDGNRNTQLKERIQAHNEQMDTMRNKLERDKMASSERIAKENKKG
jgi:predicted metallo-beta-lactamase superfamily hydrolase